MVTLTPEQIQNLEKKLEDKEELSRLGAAVIHAMLEEFKAGRDIDKVSLKIFDTQKLESGEISPYADSITVDGPISWSHDISVTKKIPEALTGRRITLVRPRPRPRPP